MSAAGGLKENWGLLAGAVLAAGFGVLAYREATKPAPAPVAAPAPQPKKARERTAGAAGAAVGRTPLKGSASAGGGAVASTPARKSQTPARAGFTTPAPAAAPARGSPNALPYIYQPASGGGGSGSGSLSKPKLKKSHSEPPTPDGTITEEKFSGLDGGENTFDLDAEDDDGGATAGDESSPVRKVPRVEYNDDDAAANALVERAIALFEEHFATVKEYKYRKKDLLVALAPGRVNLIGEHTDYNDGFVLPMAIDRACVVVGRPNGINKYRLVSGNVTDAKSGGTVLLEFDGTSILEKTLPVQWHNYFRGVVAQYMRDDSGDSKSSRVTIPGFDAVVLGDVPLGGGLSSSAALEMSTATFLDGLLDVNTTKKQKSLRCQKAEHEFANMPCGVMDQFISAHAEFGHAVLLDCRSLGTRAVKMDNPGITVLITNSNVKHALTGGEYAERRKQCEAAVAILKKKNAKILALRDANMTDLDDSQAAMDDLTFRRARHVISEDDRTLSAADALERGDYFTLGKLMFASHESLRTDFEVSCKELDVLVTIAMECKGVYGSRMTGGGFGGCTVTLVKTSDAQRVAHVLQTEYKKRLGLEATTLTTRACDGARLIKVG